MGANFFDGLAPDGRTRLPVPLWVGRLAQLTADDHVRVLRDALVPEELTTRLGVPCSRPLRATFDAARTAQDVREGVVVIDMMAAAEQVSLRQVAGYLRTRGGARGVRRVRAALRLASEDSRSPNETRMRLIWMLDAGLPAPRVNQPIFDRRGSLLGIVDLFDPEAGLVGEYDGADHRTAKRHSADVDREARLRDVGLELVRVTGPDLTSPERVVQRVRSARRRARWLPPDRRGWTVDLPDDWTPELPLHDRLEQLAEREEWEQSRDRASPDVRRV